MQWNGHRIAENHQGDCFTNNFDSAHHLRQPFDPRLTGFVAGSPPPLLPLPFPLLQLGSLAAADLSGGVQSVDVAPSAAHIADAPQVLPGTPKAQAAGLPPPPLLPPPFPPPSPPPLTAPLALKSQARGGEEMPAPDAGQPTLSAPSGVGAAAVPSTAPLALKSQASNGMEMAVSSNAMRVGARRRGIHEYVDLNLNRGGSAYHEYEYEKSRPIMSLNGKKTQNSSVFNLT